ncbi:hypothetical protein CP8484711_0851A, partial [Chlamydia psittaci 84-8471/1]
MSKIWACLATSRIV